MDQDNLDIGRYIGIFIRWWWVVLLIPIVVGGLAYAQANNQTRMYQANVDLAVQQSRSGLIASADITVSGQLADIYANLSTTSQIIRGVAEELNLSYSPKIRADGRGVILRISAEDVSPIIARDAANKTAELLMADIQSRQLLEIARLENLAESQGIPVGREVLEAQLSTIGILRIIEPAVLPRSHFSPMPKRNAVLGVVVGLIIGMGIAMLLEILAKKLRSVDQIDKIVSDSGYSLPPLGVIHHWRAKDVENSELLTRDQPASLYSEMFRRLRSGFQFARTANMDKGKVFLVTSAVPVEGKSTIASNLAVVLAQGGQKVILVDGDVRRPSIHRIFGLSDSKSGSGNGGLSGILSSGERLTDADLIDVGIPGLKLLPSGAIPPNPADLLSSASAKQLFEDLKDRCDTLLIDSPPVMAAPDPLILTEHADGVVLTVNLGQTRLDVFEHAVNQLQNAGAPLLGYVWNKAKSRQSAQGRYYHQYYAYYSNDNGAKSKKTKSKSSESRFPEEAPK